MSAFVSGWLCLNVGAVIGVLWATRARPDQSGPFSSKGEAFKTGFLLGRDVGRRDGRGEAGDWIAATDDMLADAEKVEPVH